MKFQDHLGNFINDHPIISAILLVDLFRILLEFILRLAGKGPYES